MNLKSKPTKSQELASRLELARLQQIRAESNLEHAKERARLAKRRRKEAKQVFRRARKEVKRAKIELGKTEELITETEAKLAKATKAEARKQPKAKKRTQAQPKRPRPSRLSCKAATPRNTTRMGHKGQPRSKTPAAELAAAQVPSLELSSPNELTPQ